MTKDNSILLMALAGIMSQKYLDMIDFQNTQIKVLKEIINKKRFPLNNDQRRLLAAKFKELDKDVAEKQELLVTPQTMMLWYKNLIAQKWDHSDKVKKRDGRPKLSQYIIDKVLFLLKENPTWGDDTISNRLKNLKIIVSSTTVRNIRKEHGIPPAPEREVTGSWERFLKANWESLAAIDFTTIEVMDPKTLRLETFYLLFAIRLATREVKFCGMTPYPKESWMLQVGRNLTDPFDGFFLDCTHCIMDNDTIFTKAFKNILKESGVKPKETRIKTPNMNAYIERYFLSLKTEVLKYIIPQSENQLRYIVKSWLTYYNSERNHQGIKENIIKPGNEVGLADGSIKCRTRLGDNLRYYYREAA